jgi:23S rRNA pseudouridine2605 synthase
MPPHGRSPRHQRKPKAEREAGKPETDRADSVKAVEAAQGPVSDGPVRLQKLLSSAGFGSRRACEELISTGRVTVNDQVASLGDRADPTSDTVALDGEKLVREPLVYWMVNKPEGVVTTLRDPEGRPTIMGLLPNGLPRLYPVGRLDVGTSGLVILTNDGALTQKLLHPSLGNEREYRVTVRGEVSEKTFERLCGGVHLEEGFTAPAKVNRARFDERNQTTSFFLTLTEGRKRQIRRSLMQLRHPVKKLSRVRVGPLRLKDVGSGAGRPLSTAEIEALREHARGLTRKPRPRRRRSRPPKT